jgi:hypothetical protein
MMIHGEQLDELRRELGRGKQRLRTPSKIHLDLPARIGADFIDAFNVHLVNQNTASWEFWYGLLERFVEREDHARVSQWCDENGFRLGLWVSDQRTAYANGRLAANRIARLEALPGWIWNAFADQWEEGFSHLKRFVKREGHALVPNVHREKDGYRLGAWVGAQRDQCAKGRLASDRVARLEALPGWIWDVHEEKWEEGFSYLERFVKRQGHARVPATHKAADGYRLGVWVSYQRTAYANGRLAANRIARLEALPGWIWDVHEEKWEEGFSYLERFVKRQGHARVAVSHAENGYRLGQWVGVQRNTYAKGQLAPDRIARLEALPGWSWDPFADQWKEGFRHLDRFVKREGHALVPKRHVEGSDYLLGSWVSNQRTAYRTGKLTSDQVARLEAVRGWIWDPSADQWEEGFSHLERFVKREGHARVAASHVENGYRLGQWVGVQRKTYAKGRLASDRVSRLEAVPGWTWSAPKGPKTTSNVLT